MYENWAACLYLWPASSTTSPGAIADWSGVCRSIVAVFFSETVRPVASKTTTIIAIIFARLSAVFQTNPASSAYNTPHIKLRSRANGSCSGVQTTPTSMSWTKSLPIASSWLEGTIATFNAEAKNTLNSYGDSTQPCRRHSVISNYYCECSPSSVRTLARIPSGKSQIILSIFFRTLCYS